MTLKTTNRSRRLAYMVLLLLVAVALTSALVLAGERSWDSEKKDFSERIPASAQSTNVDAGLPGWQCV